MKAQRERRKALARRQWSAWRLKSQGLSVRQIAKRLSLPRSEVRALFNADTKEARMLLWLTTWPITAKRVNISKYGAVIVDDVPCEPDALDFSTYCAMLLNGAAECAKREGR